jgi:tetratricopeptide (TPR) repeat protein
MKFLIFTKRNTSILLVFFSFIFFSCNNSKTTEPVHSTAQSKQQELIKGLETKMHASMSIDKAVGQVAAQEYFNYAENFPEDSLSPGYLFKGGEVATAIEDYTSALQAYEKITASYSTFQYSRESLYLQGFLLDNYLNDDAKAKLIYEKFLSVYTSGPYVEDAKAAIANLGKSDEELIKQFKKMNGEK